MATQNIQSVTGINESMLGVGQQDMSGVAVQSRQYAAQQQLGLPLDNLARTRNMVAVRILDCVQDFMSDERIFRITHMDGFGRPQTQEVPVNQVQPDGSILNDLTIGEYDLVISEQPMQITFDNSQFEQVKSMVKDMGIPIPPRFILRYSNLADKSEIADAIEKQQQPPQDPTVQAKAQLLQAQASAAAANVELTKAKTAQTNVTAVYSATQAAAQAEAIPHLAPVADAILESSGFPNANPIPQDAGGGIAAPVGPLSPGQVPQVTTMPNAQPESLQRMPHNTDPLTPAHPDQGVDAGIRKPGVQP
jgi:flagellum-specific peptidoglycan hydrolase FlgJ